VILNTISSGTSTSPGDIVENLLKNCRIAMTRKKLKDRYVRQTVCAGETLYVHVGNTTKLLEEVAGDKSKDGILGGDDLVGGIDIFLLDPATVVKVVVWEIFVDIDGALGPG
jgi:hypothetical protein